MFMTLTSHLISNILLTLFQNLLAHTTEMKVFAMFVLTTLVALMLENITAYYLNLNIADKNGSGKNLFFIS